jgi:hypothetical protein
MTNPIVTTTNILDTIKQMLGVPASDTAFDTDIIVGINSAFMALNQIGVGPAETFEIVDNTPEWSDFLGEDIAKYSSAKSYIYLKTRLLFDPPTVGYHLTSIENQILELGWRLSIQVSIVSDPIIV